MAPNPQLRAVLETKDAETLYAELQSKDPHRASTIDRHNKRRLMRALEIVDTLGHVPVSIGSECPYDVVTIGLHVPKEILKERLHTRAKRALDRGLIEETRSLLAQGVTYERLSEIGLEYRLVLEYLDGNLTQEALIQKLGEKNWQYAKRQMVWLKRDESIVWFTPEDTQSIFTAVDTFLDN